jgi:hypothetical protein
LNRADGECDARVRAGEKRAQLFDRRFQDPAPVARLDSDLGAFRADVLGSPASDCEA